MGLRDRLRGILGRERPAGTAVPGGGSSPRSPAVAPRVVALRVASSGPRALTVGELDPAAEIVATSEVRPVGVRLLAPASIGAFARGRIGVRPVVVVGADDEAAAAVAERLSALGVDAGWLIGGVQAWNAAGRAVLGGPQREPAAEAT